MVGTLVLLRHGESEWNATGQFTGWVDVDLTDRGVQEANRGGELLRDADLLPDVLHTSLQRRAIRTAHLTLSVCDRLWIPVRRSWRLNERHYGGLQGLDKAATREKHGEEQFMAWRRGYDTPPPPMDDDEFAEQRRDPRYVELSDEELPRTECLKDVVERFLPYWEAHVVPDLRAGVTVLVAAHGNSLRAVVKHLDRMDPDDVVGLNIPTGIPLRYDLDDDLQPRNPGGTQKTLPIGLLIATGADMFGDPDLLGPGRGVPLAVFPMLMYHASQMFLDTVVASRLRKSEV